ncbi:MAG: hypothetical protein HC922_03745 [Leptolyngbyaceae cyanobacterium SM2_3_12]|nr:hypothetical protein [Leptolyngbyaceae cyanobacterium SM2_3_12]
MSLSPSTVLELDRVTCWNIYSRLQSLSISSECGCHQPLRVTITTAGEAIQLWAVVRACTGSKQSLIDHLECCWQQKRKNA